MRLPNGRPEKSGYDTGSRGIAKSSYIQGLDSAARHLDETRISERERSPRSLPGGGDPAAKAQRRWERAARAASKAPFFPSHVKNCANNPDRVGRWTLAVWPKVTPLEHTRIAYTCGSYRCPSPECQRKAAHTDFAKIAEAVAQVPRGDGWCLLVLTIDQNETLNKRKSGNGWRDEQEAFRALSRMSRNFLARLRRWHKREGWAQFGNRWIGTVEVQGNGWPHLNLMIHSPSLARWLDEQPMHETMHKGRRVQHRPLSGELREHAIACDWGGVGDAQRARSADAVAGYVVKLAGSFDRTAGEISKLTQAPTNAKMKLRRIRAGKGFIRQRPKNASYTGIMLKREKQIGGGIFVKPMMQPDQVRCAPEEQENYLLGVREAIRAEQRQSDAEENGAHELKHTKARSDEERSFQPLKSAFGDGPPNAEEETPRRSDLARRLRHDRDPLPDLRALAQARPDVQTLAGDRGAANDT